MKNRVRTFVVIAYLVTWIGGYIAHERQMSQLAAHLYGRAQARNLQEVDWALQNGGREKPFQIELLASGPKSGVHWCIPILPGILLADSEYVVGPLSAKGSTKVIVYYGVGTITLLELWGWIS